MKKCLMVLLVVFLMASVFSGCSKQAEQGTAAAGGTAAAAAPAEEYEIVYYTWTSDANMVQFNETFDKMYEGKYFLRHVRLPNAQTMTINTALASGEKIDLMTQASAFDLRQRADAGVYLGIKQFLDRDGLDYATLFGASTEQTQNFGGEYYSFPYCTNLNFVFFNKKMFDAAGEPYPDPSWTWNDFRAIAKRMTKGTGANKVYGAMMDIASPTGDMYWASIAQQKLGAFWYYNSDLRSTRFNVPEFKESLQFFYDLTFTDQSVVPYEEYMTLKYWDDVVAMQGLFEDKYAMLTIPAYGGNYLDKDRIGIDVPAGTNIGMTNFPRPAGAADNSTIAYTSQACIPVNAPNPDASWTVLRFMCIDHADLFAGPKRMHPGYAFQTQEDADYFNDIIFRNHPGFDYDMAMEVVSLPRTIVNRDMTVVQGQADINELIRANMSMVFTGQMSVDAALADLKAKGDQYILDDL